MRLTILATVLGLYHLCHAVHLDPRAVSSTTRTTARTTTRTTFTRAASRRACAPDEMACHGGCAPWGATCCIDQAFYCMPGFLCRPGLGFIDVEDKCCDLAYDDCRDVPGYDAAIASINGGSTPTTTKTSSRTSASVTTTGTTEEAPSVQQPPPQQQPAPQAPTVTTTVDRETVVKEASPPPSPSPTPSLGESASASETTPPSSSASPSITPSAIDVPIPPIVKVIQPTRHSGGAVVTPSRVAVLAVLCAVVAVALSSV